VRIDEVKNHIGEEWATNNAGSYRSRVWAGQRVRIDAIEVKEEKTYGWRSHQTRNVRYVRVTRLNEETGEPMSQRLVTGADSDEPHTELIEAKSLDQPWANYWAETQESREAAARRQQVTERLQRFLPEGERIGTGGWGYDIALTVAGAEHLAELLEQSGA
jgi:hypothetical protein